MASYTLATDCRNTSNRMSQTVRHDGVNLPPQTRKVSNGNLNSRVMGNEA